MTDDPVTGPCPFDTCNHHFVAVDDETLAEHANDHLPHRIPEEFAARYLKQLMEFRQKQTATDGEARL